MRERMLMYSWLLAATVVGCTDREPSQGSRIADQHSAEQADLQLEIPTIERILGMRGDEEDGQYKVSVPQNDLDVSVDGFRVIPPMGVGSWVAFMPAEHGAMVMGDIVVQEHEIGPVQDVLIRNGLTVTGLHNHFVRDEPDVMYMHIGGTGSEEALARGVRAVLDKVAELRGADPSAAPAESVQNTLDTGQIAAVLGHGGAMSRGVYKVTIARPEVVLTSGGAPVTSFMGFNTWAAWQGTPENAAVAGDFAMLENEVARVIEALVEHGIEVVAVHNHMVHEEPRIFFLHYWGTGPAEELAGGLKAALDETASVRWTFDEVDVGALPAYWRAEATNENGRGAQWSVQRDPESDGRALALVDTGDADQSTFNLLWSDRIAFRDGRIEIKVAAGTGRVDQGGGPIWRVQDRDNYYVARWNPLEDNFRLYYVKDGDRRELASADVDGSADAWHTITIEHAGERIEAYFDGTRMFELTDGTFTAAGGVGVWTKADAASLFDDLIVAPRRTE